MAFKSKSKMLGGVVVVVIFLSLVLSTQAEANTRFNLAEASKALSNKGYETMSMIFDVLHKSHSDSWLSATANSSLTLFCPPDSAFLSSKYPQPPLTLLQYHSVPLKLDTLEAFTSLAHGSKVDTLLHGHPLVVTTLPDEDHGSLNGVRVAQWNVYSDGGGLIIHSVENLFDPAFQTLVYPRFDEEVRSDEFVEELVTALPLSVVGLGVVLVLVFCCVVDQRVDQDDDDDDAYHPLKQKQ